MEHSTICLDEYSIKPTYDIIMHDANGEVGRLTWGEGELKFTGEADESAMIFFEFLKPYIDEYIESRR